MRYYWWYTLLAAVFGAAFLFRPGFAPALPLALALLLMSEQALPAKNTWPAHARWWVHSTIFLLVFLLALRWRLGDFGWLDGLWKFLPLFLALAAFRWIKASLGKQRGYIALPLLWVSAEALPLYARNEPTMLHWGQALELSGNFARYSNFLGSLGASLFLLTMGILLFLILKSARRSRKNKIIGLVLWLLFYSLGPLALPQAVNEASQTRIEKSTAPSVSGLPDQEDPRLIPSAKQVVIAPSDRFTARMSFFLAVFLLLFSLVKNIMNPQKKKDDRSTQ